MKVNHNIAAVLANNRLQITEGNLSNSVARLSSGYKINSAKDNPAGFAIAHRMQTQIRGLEKASNNALDGVSAIQTAEGAINEIQEMVQRMRELAVQSANDTYTLEDREAIQAEAEKLQEEIQRISEQTEFNKKNLLDGTFDTRVFESADGVSVNIISEDVAAGNYQFKVTAVPTATTLTGGTIDSTKLPQNPETAYVCINQIKVEFSTSESIDDIYGKLRDAAEVVGVKATLEKDANNNIKNLLFTSEELGSDHDIQVIASSNAAEALGLDNRNSNKGEDLKIELYKYNNETSRFTETASYTAQGNYVTITDRGGFEMTVKIDDEVHKTLNKDLNNPGGKSIKDDTVTLDVKNYGAMSLQIGTNENQTMDVKIPNMSLENMGIDKINYLTHESASEVIEKMDNAMAFISNVRARLGAYENRLDHTMSSLDVADLSMTEAYSRLMDTDMAEEMTKYTQYNVLQQAGVSVLAQANDLPQTILQLLQ